MTSADYFDELPRALSHDRRLAWELGRILDRAQRLNMDFRGHARRRLREEAALLAYRLEHRRGQIWDVDLSIVDYAYSAVESATIGEANLANAVMATRCFLRAVETASVLDPEREPSLRVLADVVFHLELAAADIATLAGLFAEAERKVARPPRVSRQLANLAVRLLPWEHRDRYLNEYLSELDELVQDASLSRRAQLRHALRLLVRTPALRLALRAPAQEEHLPMTTESR